MAKRSKIGRNDPCPCGSGKKYKNCCGLLEGTVTAPGDPFGSYSEMLVAVKMKLDQAFNSDIRKNRRYLQTRFTRFTVKQHLPAEWEGLFSDWIWFNEKNTEGKTMAASYLEDHGDFMEKPLYQCLQALSHSYPSVYQVEGYADMHLHLVDIFLQHPYQVLVKEPLDASMNLNSILLLGRLVEMPAAPIFSGMVLMLENDALQKEFLLDHFQYLLDLLQEPPLAILQDHGDLVYGLFDHALQKTLFNLGDIRVQEIDNSQRQDLLLALDRSEEMEFQHETGGFKWYRPTEAQPGYTRIAINDNVVLSCADVIDDVLAGQNFIRNILKKEELHLLGSKLAQQPPLPHWAPLWFAVLKDQETERWLQTPHAELGGKTPLAALEEATGRETLIKMLDRLLNNASSDEQKELLEYMRERVEDFPESPVQV